MIDWNKPDWNEDLPPPGREQRPVSTPAEPAEPVKCEEMEFCKRRQHLESRVRRNVGMAKVAAGLWPPGRGPSLGRTPPACCCWPWPPWPVGRAWRELKPFWAFPPSPNWEGAPLTLRTLWRLRAGQWRGTLLDVAFLADEYVGDALSWFDRQKDKKRTWKLVTRSFSLMARSLVSGNRPKHWIHTDQNKSSTLYKQQH